MTRRLLAALGAALLCLAGPAAAARVCTLLVEADSGKVIARQGAQCDLRNSPASTFKLAIAVMGYDAGILTGPYTPEYEAWMESWKTTVDPTTWLRDSVVWYSRQITARLGPERFQQGVDRL